MKLSVLGCHGGASLHHRTSSFLVDDTLALDAGAVCSMLTLEAQRAIREVLITHSHFDHVRELSTLVDNRCQQGGPTLDVYALQETIDTLKTHFFNNLMWPDFSTIQTPFGPALRFHPLHFEQEIQIREYRILPVEMNHTVASAGFLIRHGDKVLAYSGDTGPTDRFWEVLNDCPGLKAVIAEVALPNAQQHLADLSKHHTPASLGRDLDKLDVRDVRILLFHLKPVFESVVKEELAALPHQGLRILELGEELHID